MKSKGYVITAAVMPAVPPARTRSVTVSSLCCSPTISFLYNSKKKNWNAEVGAMRTTFVKFPRKKPRMPSSLYMRRRPWVMPVYLGGYVWVCRSIFRRIRGETAVRETAPAMPPAIRYLYAFWLNSVFGIMTTSPVWSAEVNHCSRTCCITPATRLKTSTIFASFPLLISCTNSSYVSSSLPPLPKTSERKALPSNTSLSWKTMPCGVFFMTAVRASRNSPLLILPLLSLSKKLKAISYSAFGLLSSISSRTNSEKVSSSDRVLSATSNTSLISSGGAPDGLSTLYRSSSVMYFSPKSVTDAFFLKTFWRNRDP
eukprot:Colp12_sorted_trinity150504_noHs@23779